MRAAGLGLAGRIWSKKVFTTRAGGGAAVPADRVGRQIARGQRNEMWVADSTYIRVREGFGCLAVVMDAGSRCLIGRQFSLCHNTELMLGDDGRLGFRDMQWRLYDYIDGFYNAECVHSKLGQKSPIEYERDIFALSIS